MKRISLKVAGASGMGLVSVGNIVSKVLQTMGFYVHSDREFPSLIKGGHSNLQIDFSKDEIHSLSREVDLLIALDKDGLMGYIDKVKKGGVIVHAYDRYDKIKELNDIVKKKKINLLYIPAHKIAYDLGGNSLMTNVVLLGLMWKVLGLDIKPLEKAIKKQFATKPKLLEIDLNCMKAGYKAKDLGEIKQHKIDMPKKSPNAYLLDGNIAIALGAIEAGARSYFVYPMSPSSSILTHLSNFSHKTNMMVKQVEDEITAAEMTLGAMTMGTRSLTATSGGGYDLMTETVSLAGMIESPWLCVLCQRPGPATGLPTWTGQGDLNMVINSSHGEFPRLVISASDPKSCYELVQHAFNYAEEFQIPVILLSEKTITEAKTMVDNLDSKIPIKRGLVKEKDLDKLVSSDRYKITKSGISSRWLPGRAKAGYYANGDEHKEDGSLTEDAVEASAMYAKRMRKMESLKKAIPDAKVYGEKSNANISFVSWGSNKPVILDAIKEMKELGIKVNYLHYEYMWPFKEKAVKDFFKKNKNIHVVESNYQGQFANIIKANTGLEFKGKLLKFDGRIFYLEDILDYINKNLKK